MTISKKYNSMIEKIIVKYPWVFLIAVFLMISGAWATLIEVARKYSPEVIEVKKHSSRDK